jgi:hypothetical protein
MQTPPYPPWDPAGSHLDKNRGNRGHPGVGRPPRSTDPTLRPLAPPFHVSSCRDEPKVVPGVCSNICPKACNSFSMKIHQLGPHSFAPHVTTSLVLWWRPRQPRELLLPINMRGGVENRTHYTTSPKDECFPSKERPLGRLESRSVRERERVVFLRMLVLQLE